MSPELENLIKEFCNQWLDNLSISEPKMNMLLGDATFLAEQAFLAGATYHAERVKELEDNFPHSEFCKEFCTAGCDCGCHISSKSAEVLKEIKGEVK